MEAQTIIKLHEFGFIDAQGQVCEETVGEIGYEDGEAFGVICAKAASCGETMQLLELELELKESYRLMENRPFVDALYIIAGLFEYQLSRDVSVMVESEPVIDYYLQHFLMGFSDEILEKVNHCRKCHQGQ